MSDPRGRPRRRAPSRSLLLMWARARLRWQRARARAGRAFRRLVSVAEESLLGPQQAANERSLYLETFWFGILNGVSVTFLGVFAVRLGATPFQIGLLTALPALVNVIIPIPAARLIERQKERLPFILRSVVWQRLAYLLLALTPFLGSRFQVGAIILLMGLATIPAAFLNLSITVLIGDLATPRDRSLVVSRRSIILAGTTTLVALLGGWWLDLVPFPLNYQCLFAVGAVASLLGLRYLRRIQLPYSPPPAEERRQGHRGVDLRGTWRELTTHGPFWRFTFSAFFYHWGLFLPGALWAIYRVRNLGANDRWIGLITMTFTASAVLGYSLAGRYARRWGERRLLIVCSAVLCLYPVLTALSTSLPPLLGVAVIGGIFSSGLALALFNTTLALAPEDRRATYVALYTMLINVAAFLAPLAGSLLAEAMGIRETLYLSGGLRLLGVGLFAVALSGRVGRRTASQ